MSSPEAKRCGQCNVFDIYNASRELIGTKLIQVEGIIKEVSEGYCRGPLGLCLGPKTELSICNNPGVKNGELLKVEYPKTSTQ